MSKLAKDRGASYEREVCKALSDALGSKVTRVLGQARDGGSDIDLGPFMIDCKRLHLTLRHPEKGLGRSLSAPVQDLGLAQEARLLEEDGGVK